jgi:hypothetical protein
MTEPKVKGQHGGTRAGAGHPWTSITFRDGQHVLLHVHPAAGGSTAGELLTVRIVGRGKVELVAATGDTYTLVR